MQAFTAILKVNFKDTGIGPRMIEMGEFVIQESGSQLEIDLSKPWEMCFSPGQRVAMSMVFFTDFPHFENYCPRCDTLAQGSLEEEIEWLVYVPTNKAIINNKGLLRANEDKVKLAAWFFAGSRTSPPAWHRQWHHCIMSSA